MRIKFLIVLLVMGIVLVGCTNAPVEQPELEDDTPEQDTPSDGDLDDASSDPDQPVSDDPENEDTFTILPVEEETDSVKGIYLGRMDTGAIEVLVDGAYKVFRWHMDEEEAQTGEIQPYTAIDIVYSTNEQEAQVVSNLTLAPEPGTPEIIPYKEEAVFIRYMGESQCYLEIEEQPHLFWFALELMESEPPTLTEDETIQASYYMDDYGRQVIVSYETLN